MRSFVVCFAVLVMLAAVGVARGGQMEKQAGSFDSDGVKIAYVTAGQGEAVVLIHGLYSSAAINWELPGTFAMLAQHYHVVALDLRGHRTSPPMRRRMASRLWRMWCG